MSEPVPQRSKELVRSFLLGPLRSLGPAILNILLYPILLAHGGLATIGIWGSINLVISSVMLADLGFSQFFGRTLARGDAGRRELQTNVEMIFTVWAIITLVFTIGALSLMGPMSAVLGVQPTYTFALAVVLVALAGYLSLVCASLNYLLIGAEMVSVAQMNDLRVSGLQFIVAAGLVQVSEPFLALACAIAVRFAARAAGLYLALRRHNVFVASIRPVRPKVGVFAVLLKESGGFALLRISQQSLQIVNRTAVLAVGGPAMLGAFETASRIPLLLEQAISNGLVSFFPIFSAADWTTADGRVQSHSLVRWAYRLLLASSVGALGAWIALAGPIIGIWLNLADPSIVFATQLFGIYNLVRAMNIFTFLALQARGGETSVGLLYGAQAVFTGGALMVAGALGYREFTDAAIIIAVLGCISEVLLVLIAQLRTHFLSVAIAGLGDLVSPLCAGALAITAWLVSSGPVLRAHAVAPALRDGALYFGIWLIIVLTVSRVHPLTLLKPPAH